MRRFNIYQKRGIAVDHNEDSARPREIINNNSVNVMHMKKNNIERLRLQLNESS